MKKFLATMFAAMLFVPTFAGCGGGSEAEMGAADETNPNGDQTDEDYSKKMEEMQNQAKQ